MNKVALWLLCVLVALTMALVVRLDRKVEVLSRKSAISLGKAEAKAIEDLGSEYIAKHGGDIRAAYKAKAVERENRPLLKTDFREVRLQE